MYEYNCKIVRVIDGDSIIIDIDLGFSHFIHNESIRLYGVDTPECRTRDAEEKDCRTLGKEVCRTDASRRRNLQARTREKGKFGRYLGVIKITGNLTINTALVTEHLAVPYMGQNKQEIEDAHKENYKILKDRGLV